MDNKILSKTSNVKKAGMTVNNQKVSEFINIVLLLSLFYTYLQFALIQKEYSMFRQYNHASVPSVSSVPNLPKISDLK